MADQPRRFTYYRWVVMDCANNGEVLGEYDDPNEAAEAFLAAEKEYGSEACIFPEAVHD